MQLLDFLRDKMTPSPKTMRKMKLVAGALLCFAGPIGIVLGCLLMANAIYEGSALQKWVDKKLFPEVPDKLDDKALENITAKGLVQDVEKMPQKEQEQTKETSKEKGEGVKGQDKEDIVRVTKDNRYKETEVKNMNEKALLDKEIKEEVGKIIKKNKKKREMAKKGGEKSYSLDDTDLMSARLKVENRRKLSKGGIQK